MANKMVNKNILENQKKFDSWQADILFRINFWVKTYFSKKESLIIDYSLDSLIGLEKILLKKHSMLSIKDKNNNEELDGFVSYLGETIIKLVDESEWVIYLNDKTNIFYGLPCIKTKYSGSISVHFLLKDILTQGTGDVLKDKIDKVISYDSYIREILSK